VAYAGAFDPEQIGEIHQGAPLFVPDFVRDSFLQRARLHLVIQKSEHHNLISISRLCHSVINRIPMLIEYDGAPNEYGPFATFAPAEALLDSVGPLLDPLASGELVEQPYQQLRAEMPMGEILRRALGSIGI
jgi:hypothetical protein